MPTRPDLAGLIGNLAAAGVEFVLCDADCRAAWVRNKGALVWTALSPDGIEQVDVFLSYPISWEDLAKDARIMQVRGFPVKISSREHLIQAKRTVVPPRRKDLQRDSIRRQIRNLSWHK